MFTATTSFVEALENWTSAIRAADLSTARKQAADLSWKGELLVIHPDFYHCFEMRCPGTSPELALKIISQFLLCATECCAQAQKT